LQEAAATCLEYLIAPKPRVYEASMLPIDKLVRYAANRVIVPDADMRAFYVSLARECVARKIDEAAALCTEFLSEGGRAIEDALMQSACVVLKLYPKSRLAHVAPDAVRKYKKLVEDCVSKKISLKTF
jgi:hypothetical protein